MSGADFGRAVLQGTRFTRPA
ncbi:MAG: hypothetical protein R3F37_13850 [Candidatus Competibacteraceae bacterium]